MSQNIAKKVLGLVEVEKLVYDYGKVQWKKLI